MTHDHAKLAALNQPVTEMLTRLERRIHRVASELQRLHIAHDVMTTMILEGK